MLTTWRKVTWHKIDANFPKGKFTYMKLMWIWCNTNISTYIFKGNALHFLAVFPWSTKKKSLQKKITAKIFLEKNILHCRQTLTLTACDFLKIAKVYSQKEKHLSCKCFVPHSVHFTRFFINIIIIWDHIQMPNIFHDKTVYNK